VERLVDDRERMTDPPIGSAPLSRPGPDGDSVFAMTTLQQVMDDQRQFAVERDWGQFHTPKNLAMALGGEVGELAVAVADALTSPTERLELSELHSVTSEIADVTLYLLRLFDVLGCALPERQVKERHNDVAGDREHLILVTLARLVGRVGAILELWQWLAPEEIQKSPERVEHRMVAALDDLDCVADLAGVKLAYVAAAKLASNADRYPVGKSFGSRSKYTDFK
jgi:NTP pyrophosphatase (non-canonical NTP hydrolase)